tara:strand:+ start:649 stop:924 length:276 start_codon:yes stop_codon:yes gene_type:complete
MPIPVAMLAGAALRGVGKLGLFTGITGLAGKGASMLAAPKDYEKNFDYEKYSAENPRFYDESLITEDNPKGFNEPLFNEAMVEFHKIQPMY